VELPKEPVKTDELEKELNGIAVHNLKNKQVNDGVNAKINQVIEINAEIDELENKISTLKMKVIDLDIDLRDAAKQSKIGVATLSRMENGGVPEIDTFIKACNWLKVSVCEFIKPKK